MPLPANNNNKESFRLLDLSSDGSSEDLQLEIAPVKKKRVHRKNRSRGGTRLPEASTRESPWQRNLRIAGWALVVSWLIALSFVLSAINQRLEGIDAKLHIVSTTSDGVNDAIQSCHSAAKELRANTSSLADRLERLSRDHDALADNLTETASQLAKLQEKLAQMPEQTKAPVPLDKLVQMVGDMGSRLNGIDVAVKTAQETANAAKQGLEDLRTAVNVSSIARKDASEQLKRLNEGVAALNDTIATKLNQTETKLNDYAKRISEDSVVLQEIRSQLSSLTSRHTEKPPTLAADARKKAREALTTVPASPLTSPAPLVATVLPDVKTDKEKST